MDSKVSPCFGALNTVQENKSRKKVTSCSDNHIRQNYMSGKNWKNVYLGSLCIHVTEKLFSNMHLMTLQYIYMCIFTHVKYFT